jgi:hypothetical protein
MAARNWQSSDRRDQLAEDRLAIQQSSATARQNLDSQKFSLDQLRVGLGASEAILKASIARFEMVRKQNENISAAIAIQRLGQLDPTSKSFQRDWAGVLAEHSDAAGNAALREVMKAQNDRFIQYHAGQQNLELEKQRASRSEGTESKGANAFYSGVLKTHGLTAENLNEIDATPGVITYRDPSGNRVSAEAVKGATDKHNASVRLGNIALDMPLNKFNELMQTHRNLQAQPASGVTARATPSTAPPATTAAPTPTRTTAPTPTPTASPAAAAPTATPSNGGADFLREYLDELSKARGAVTTPIKPAVSGKPDAIDAQLSSTSEEEDVEE